MASKVVGRVRNDLRDIKEDQGCSGFKLDLKSDDFTKLKGEIPGPVGTPYEGATFILDIDIPNNYPFDPPKIVFVTKVWHPNINSETGEICLDILKNQWVAVMTLRTVFLSIQSLLSAAEPNDALNGFAAKQFHRSQELFSRTARHWAFTFARGPSREVEFEEKISELKNFGFEGNSALIALSNQNWDFERAAESLLLNDQDLY